jgi:hypothetical protein
MKKTTNIYLISASLLVIFIHILDFIPKINNFEDELIALTSHIFFLTELEFKAPFLVEEMIFTPALTTGFNSSVGGAFGWLIFKDFYFSRLFNFIWLVLEISLLNFYLYKNKIINVKFLYYSILGLFCIPLWYNSLYGLGEILSSIVFFNSLLLYEKNKKLSMFLMSISIFFGKFIILLSFLVFIGINIKKQNVKNILYFAIPPTIWLFIIYIKTGLSGLVNYLNEFVIFLFGHGLSKSDSSSNFYQEVKNNIAISEIADWSYVTIIRTSIVPLAFSLFLLSKFLLKKNSKTDLSISIIIIINYLYFYLFSYQKYLRYSQIFLVITIFYLLYLLSNEEKLSNFEKFTFILFLSFYASSELLIFFLIIYSILSYKKKSIFILLFTFLLLNIVNLQYESMDYVSSNLNIYECKNNISSIECISNYLPYEYKIRK